MDVTSLFSPLSPNAWTNGVVCTWEGFSVYSAQQAVWYASAAFDLPQSEDGAGLQYMPCQLAVWGWPNPEPLYAYIIVTPISFNQPTTPNSWTVEGGAAQTGLYIDASTGGLGGLVDPITGDPITSANVGQTVEITGGTGFTGTLTAPQDQIITSVVGGLAFAVDPWGTLGSTGGSGDIFVLVDTQTGQTWPGSASVTVSKIFFPLDTTKFYYKYRLNISANNGGTNDGQPFTQIGQLILFSSDIQIQITCQQQLNSINGSGGANSQYELLSAETSEFGPLVSPPLAFGSFNSYPGSPDSLILAQLTYNLECSNAFITVDMSEVSIQGPQANMGPGLSWSLGEFRCPTLVDCVDLLGPAGYNPSFVGPPNQMFTDVDITYTNGNFPSDWTGIQGVLMGVGVWSGTAATSGSTITITNACWLVVLALAALCPNPCMTVGVPYSGYFQISGGVPPYGATILSNNLPPGIYQDPDDPTHLIGTPLAEGLYCIYALIGDSSDPILDYYTCCCFSVGNPCGAPSTNGGNYAYVARC